MPSTYSPLLRLELITPGEQGGLWGNTTNTNLGTLIEQAIAGSSFITLTADNVTNGHALTYLNGATDQARSAVLNFTGTPGGAVTVTVPSSQKWWIVRNACGSTVTLKTAAQVGGVAVPNGDTNLVYCDGTNAYTFSSVSLTSGVAGILPIANGGTGTSSSTGTGAGVHADSPVFTGAPLAPTPSIAENSTRLATTAFVQQVAAAVTASAMPTGIIVPYGGPTPPAGYLLCDGSAVSRDTYANLFAIIGTAYGVGNNSTTFNVPNLTDRFPVGAGNLYARGALGGSKDATLPTHSHTFSATSGTESADHSHSGGTTSVGDHAHTITIGASTGGSGYPGFDGSGDAWTTGTSGGAGAHAHSFTTGGRSAAHTHAVSGTTSTSGISGTNMNMPPYLGAFYIIKT